MPWERRTYRGHKAWILIDEEGGIPSLDDRGLVQLRYRPDDDRTYSVRPDEVRPLEEADPPTTAEPIEIWAEAAVGGPGGGAGIGIVLLWRGRKREIARTLPSAPLPRVGVVAVVEALRAIRRPGLPVRIHTQHVEAVNALRAGRRGSEPTPLACELRRLVRRFADLGFVVAEPDATSEHARRAGELARRAAGSPRGP